MLPGYVCTVLNKSSYFVHHVIPFAMSQFVLAWLTDTVQSVSPKKMPKKPYAKANITNSADELIRRELDDADSALEKVIHCVHEKMRLV